MTPELRFPDVIDNSMRKELVKCQKIAHWKFERGLNAPGNNVDLHAGGAFSKAMEVLRTAYYVQRKSQELALSDAISALYTVYGNFQCPEGKFKTADRMAGALTYYLSEHPLADDEYIPLELSDGKLGIEIVFQHPTKLIHPVTGRVIPYVGRFDMLAEDTHGYVWIVDEKSTGKMGDAWVHQWDLDSQMTGYCWGAQKLLEQHNIDKEIKGAIINGVGILKYDYAVQRVHTYRQPWVIDRWYQQMIRDIENWIEVYKEQSHNMVLDHACALYNNPCVYSRLCVAQNPERLIDGNFKVHFWNPLTRE